MSYGVSSWFVEQSLSENPPVKRIFTITGSDYSDYVMGWPTINSRWDELKPNNVTINLSNEDQTFNFFKAAKSSVQAPCVVKFGFTHPTSGDELITMFSGKAAEVSFKDASVSLRLVDKIQQLSDKIVGTTNSSAIFSGSTLLPSDIAWTLCTCYGGLSSVANSSNPDIDYQAWKDWAAVFSADAVYMGASFTGQKVTEALRKLMENTQSAGFMADNKLTFARWTTVNTRFLSLDANHIKSLGMKVRADSLINRQWVEFAFDTTSKSWNYSVFAQNDTSVNSFGVRETILKDESVWYINSSNALNMAQRSLFVNAFPYEQVEVDTTLVACYQQVGETIAAIDTHLGLSEGWRIMGLSMNLDNGSIKLDIDGSQINTPFLLDYSLLDGTDIIL